ncbi:hypothetical protein [Micromonospora aurantiaca (nom. illeg.)]|uniref:hypothetical protein n=1 Tax=Micromonospora aurantiaca (nom. illeg.) TaxID=47850 RepID=UPI0011A04F6E|nr:hypothetical protein [Micromonospora aurantiaca]MBC9000509.1 hypothetical protein [Micromonospora aurantiaca]
MQAPDEWTLTYPGRSLTWGPYASGIMLATEPQIGAVELLTDDAPRPRGDGRLFGQDFRGGQTITFELLVLGDSELAVRQRQTDLALAWRADAVRSVPGMVAELSTVIAGRPRVAYGRPRRFAPAAKQPRQGVIPVVCDFAAVDDCWYDPVLEQETVSLVPPPSGGLVSPLITPLTTVPTGAAPGGIVVGGELPAWPVITLRAVSAPLTNPVVQVTGLWTMALNVTILAGQHLTIDTRPWRRSVLRGDGASFGGALTRTGVRLADAAVPPGTYEVVMRGQDVSGTAQMQFAWQKTYGGL